MGRLFWKFFFAFIAALLSAGFVVGAVLSLLHEHERAQRAEAMGYSPSEWRDEHPSREMHPRHSFGPLGANGPNSPIGPPEAPPEGHPYPGPHASPYPGPPPGPHRGHRPTPWFLLVPALLGGLAGSVWLAWYFAKPVRHLRWALGALAAGKLETRVLPLMDGRRDEIADLGRDVDAMAQQLQQLVESQRRLMHDVSHELRSPLARLQAAIGLARQDPSKVAATFDRLEREALRLDTLVGQLLALSRLEVGAGSTGRPSGRRCPEEGTAPIDVIELLADIAADARFEAQANGRELSFTGSGEFLIAGHGELLHRAFENVLRNAVKFTVPGSTVEVTATISAASAEDATRCLQVCVDDRGPGVPEQELSAIFEPFHRCGGNPANDGFGLGLAIAQRAIALHGGRIVASNRDGGGLRIAIELAQA